jgi:uncharacterized protein (TIGR03437 family)
MTFSSVRFKSPHLLLFLGLSLAVPAAFSQTLTITGGQGQLLLPVQQSAPLSVKLLDANGNPIVGAPVTFNYTDAFSTTNFLTLQQGITDSNGMAFTYLYGVVLAPGQTTTYVPGQVIANYNGVIFSPPFYETTSGTTATNSPLVSVSFAPLNSFSTVSGQAGSTSSSPLSVMVNSNAGGVPNIALSLVIDPSSTGSFSCQEGPFPLTNAAGIVTCTPVFGKVGSGTFTVSVGGFNSNIPIPFVVTVGPPALINILSGNNQGGTPGQQLPLPIVAQVTDMGGNVISGVAMNFTANPANGATFTSTRNVSDSSGKVSSTVILGSNPGPVQITVSDAAGLVKNPAVFTETVNVSITGITKNSGDPQSAFVNTAFSVPLTVTVNNSLGKPLASLPVTFAVTSGSATVATPNATTNANGQASTAVTAGGTAGPVVVTATAAGFSVTFNLTVIPPGPSNLSFANGASGAVNSLSAGAIVTINGNGLANNIQGVTSAFDIGPLPLSMAGVTVQFGQTYAPIIDVGNVNGSQFVSIQVPYEVPTGSTSVTVNTAGGGTTTVPVTVLQASPGLFTYAVSGQQYLVAIKSNGTVAGPSNPASRGETVTMYMTGVPLNPTLATNSFPAPGATQTPAYPIILGIANQGAVYNSVAYSPDLPGVETMTFTVPTTLTPGPGQISIGVQAPSGAQYSQGATLNVQ